MLKYLCLSVVLSCVLLSSCGRSPEQVAAAKERKSAVDQFWAVEAAKTEAIALGYNGRAKNFFSKEIDSQSLRWRLFATHHEGKPVWCSIRVFNYLGTADNGRFVSILQSPDKFVLVFPFHDEKKRSQTSSVMLKVTKNASQGFVTLPINNAKGTLYSVADLSKARPLKKFLRAGMVEIERTTSVEGLGLYVTRFAGLRTLRTESKEIVDEILAELRNCSKGV